MKTEQELRRHPLLGHTMARPCPHHDHPYSLKGPLVRVRAMINEVLPEENGRCDGHQRLMLDILEVYEVEGADETIIRQDETFCAIHYGSGGGDGLEGPIEGLAVGEEIEIRGEYLDTMNPSWHPSRLNDDLPMLHFTHAPYGLVKYKGCTYQ